MPHILVVDDDDLILSLLERVLKSAEYEVSTTATGEGMRRILDEGDVDLVLLDIRLGQEHGFILAREIADRHGTPVIFVTGDDDVMDKVVGLEIGADDYITKPFDQRELLARVKAVLRRGAARARDSGERRLRFAGFVLDLDAHELHAPDGTELDVTGLELAILACLARHARQALSRDDISREVSGRVRSRRDRTIDVVVSKLRRKLESASEGAELIQTVRGVGYKLAADIETADA